MTGMIRKLLMLLLGCTLGLIIAMPTVQGQKEPEPGFASSEVLVRIKEGASPTGVHGRLGATVLRTFQIVPGLQLVRLPANLKVPEAIKLYKQDPDVVYAEPNYIYKKAQQALLTPNDPQFNLLYGLHNTGQTGGTPDADIDAVEAWDISTGSSSVVVFVIDTGADYNHEDLITNRWVNPDEIAGNGLDDDSNGYVDDIYGIDTAYNDSDPMDGHGHGTHVSGTIGAIGDNNIGVVGVNWNVKIGQCKFLNDSGSGYTSDAIECLQYILTEKTQGSNIIATNNSWGGGGFSQALYDAIQAHMNAGILFFAAAGNSSANNDTGTFYPANYYLPNLVAVAATDHNDALATFSNYGLRTVHVGAPGKDIRSTTPGNTYDTYSGTSMATPHVTGLAALIKAQFPAFNWYQIRNRIFASGDVKASLTGKTVTKRRINAYGALTCSSTPFFGILRPISAARGQTVTVAVVNVDCESPAGALTVTVNPGGPTVPLVDDGVAPDLAAGDGIYSATLTIPAGATICDAAFSLDFSNGHSEQFGSVGSYTCTTPPIGWRTITGTNLNLGDDQSVSVSPGFSVQFGTSSYSSVNVGSNGIISFTNSITAYSNTQLPNTSYTTVIAPFWDDLYPSGADNVYWGTLGSAPNRELVIEWRNVRHYSCRTDPAATVRFQVVFFEASNNVLFNYQDVLFGGACTSQDKGGSATVGVQVSTTDATQIGFNSQILNDNMAVFWGPGSPPSAGALLRVERATGSVFTDGAYYCGLGSGCFNTGVGADIAEGIEVSEAVEPGDVVEVDPDNRQHYRKARTAYSALIAGVVSSTPGLVMGHGLGEDRRPFLALIGRVPVKATGENGPIRPGDLLTSASKPGYAMRCESAAQCEGALLGKALESLEDGDGVILMLVMR